MLSLLLYSRLCHFWGIFFSVTEVPAYCHYYSTVYSRFSRFWGISIFCALGNCQIGIYDPKFFVHMNIYQLLGEKKPKCS